MMDSILCNIIEVKTDGNTAFLRAARSGNLEKVLEFINANIDINAANSNGLNALHLASKDGHTEVVSELLKRGANVDAATKKGNTALHIASLAGQEEVVKLLIEHGASVNVQSQSGFTPLYMAAQENHDKVVRYLLNHGANQSLATEDGFTPLAVAMQQGHDKVVTELLENDTRGKIRLPALHIAAKKDDCKAAALLLQSEHNPDITSKSGFTPLHIASHYGNDAIASLLLAKGADVNYTAKHNITPLHVAAKWGRNNMVILLLEKGASITAKTRDGLTPLHCAARSGHEQVVDTLLQRHAPITAKTKNGLAPLHMASQGDHVDAARVLLSHRAPVDDVTVDYLTALHVASHCGHVSVAKLLLDRKADPNARALNGFTPLHIACKKNRVKIVELLLKHGASIEATTESGLSPLHVASFMGCMNIVIYLLQCEANPDVATIRGETPLHLAARANQTDIIRILLRNGAQVDAKAREQQTPLHIAARVGNTDIVMLLLQHGANVDSVTKDLYTSLHIAAKEGQEEVAQTLLENGASITAATKKGFTPLHLAAKYGHPKLATLFLQRGASIDAQGKNGVTPLHVASHYDHQGIALLLLDKGASPHTAAKSGHTPLHIAAKKNQMDLAAMLLEYGANAAVESKLGFTPLHLAALEGHVDMTNLLLEHKADVNYRSGNGLTPLHVCAQEDCVDVAKILINNGADVNAVTMAGYTPIHVASHFGQLNMVRFLLSQKAKVDYETSTGYTPLHQASQQGNSAIVALLLDNGSSPDSKNNQGQTALYIAQKLGYISVVEVLKNVTEAGKGPAANNEDKYKVVVPETIQESFMSDSEDEGGEDVTNEQSYRYLTVDEMKSLGDDSMPLDTTKEDRYDTTAGIDESISPQHTYNQLSACVPTPDNVDFIRTPIIQSGFLVSFLVDAKGGAMRGCRHSGVRVIVPPQCVSMPTRVTCRYVRKEKPNHPPPPPLMEGEALASRILELGPVNVKFLGPVVIEVPNFAALRGNEREIVILRSDNGETWREHTMDSSPETVQEILSRSFDKDGNQIQSDEPGRITSIVSTDFPHYFAVVSRIRQEVHAIGPEGGMVSSSVVPQVQAVFPPGALTKKIKVGLQAQPIPSELTVAILGNCVAVSPIVTIEPRRRKFHKPITLTLPVPQAANKGMINQYSGDAPTLRLLCSITGGTSRAQWEDVTGSTPLTFVKECVSFTTTVSARFWLMDIRDIAMATKKATELYREAILTPFMAKFVVFAKRIDNNEARLRVFCMTDDKEDKTLECQEHFTEVAKSRDVEVLEGKRQLLELSGNLISVTKSGDQLQLGFSAFHENRLPFTVRVKDMMVDPIGRMLFFKEHKPIKTGTPHPPICVLNIVLPDGVIPDPEYNDSSIRKCILLNDLQGYHRSELRLSDISNLIGEDWELLAEKLGVSPADTSVIKSEYNQSVAQQALTMLRIWHQQTGSKASQNILESALLSIGRQDIVQECILNSNETLKRKNVVDDIIEEYQVKKDTPSTDDDEKKYTAEEKAIDELDTKKSVSERKEEIEKRLRDDKPRKMSKERNDSEERRQITEPEPKVVRRENSQPKEMVKKASEERKEGVEPTTFSFEQKRLSFERGVSIEKIVNEEIIEDIHTNDEKDSQAQSKTDFVTQVGKAKSVIVEEAVEEKPLTFAEKRLSFEQSKLADSKDSEKKEEMKFRSSEDKRRDSELFEGVSEGLNKMDNEPVVDRSYLFLKQISTPPPSPAEFKGSKQKSQNGDVSKPVIQGQIEDRTSSENDSRSSGSTSEFVESSSHPEADNKAELGCLEATGPMADHQIQVEESFVQNVIQPLSRQEVEVENAMVESAIISTPAVDVQAEDIKTESIICEIPMEESRIAYEIAQADSFTLNVQPVQVVCDLSNAATVDENEDASKLDEFINQYVANLTDSPEPNENAETVVSKLSSDSESNSEHHLEKLLKRKVAFRLNSTDDGLVYPGQTDSEELSSSETSEEEEEEEEEEEVEEEEEQEPPTDEKPSEEVAAAVCKPKITESERKFERMASESTDEEDGKRAEGEFHRMVSQVSVEEIDDSLNEWDQRNASINNKQIEGDVQLQHIITERKSISSQSQSKQSDVTQPQLHKQENMDYNSKKKFWQSFESSSTENKSTPTPVPKPRASICTTGMKDESPYVISKRTMDTKDKVIKSESEDNVLFTTTCSSPTIKKTSMAQMHSLTAYSTDSEAEYIASCGIEKLAFENVAFSEEDEDVTQKVVLTGGGVKAKKEFFEHMQKDSSSSQDDSIVVPHTAKLVQSEEHVDKSEVEPTEKKSQPQEYEDPSVAAPIDICFSNSAARGADSSRPESDIMLEHLKDNQHSLSNLESVDIMSHEYTESTHSIFDQMDIEEKVKDGKLSAPELAKVSENSKESDNSKVDDLSSLTPMKHEVSSKVSTQGVKQCKAVTIESPARKQSLDGSKIPVRPVKRLSISSDKNKDDFISEISKEPLKATIKDGDIKIVELETNIYKTPNKEQLMPSNNETTSECISVTDTYASKIPTKEKIKIIPKDDSKESLNTIEKASSKTPLTSSQSEIVTKKIISDTKSLIGEDIKLATGSKIPISKSFSDSKMGMEISNVNTIEKNSKPLISESNLAEQVNIVSADSISTQVIEDTSSNLSFNGSKDYNIIKDIETDHKSTLKDIKSPIEISSEDEKSNSKQTSIEIDVSKSNVEIEQIIPTTIESSVNSCKDSDPSTGSCRKDSGGSSKHVIFNEYVTEKVIEPIDLQDNVIQPPTELNIRKVSYTERTKSSKSVDEVKTLTPDASEYQRHAAFFEPVDLSDEMIEIPDEAEAKIIAKNLVDEIEIEINKRPDVVENLILSMNMDQLDEISNDITDEDLRSTGTEMDINILEDDLKSEHSGSVSVTEIIPTECEINYEQVEEFNVFESVDFEELESKNSSHNLTLVQPSKLSTRNSSSTAPEVDRSKIDDREPNCQDLLSPESVLSEPPPRSERSKSNGKSADIEPHSSSSESHYQSLASGNCTGSSRPCSSDVEMLLSCPLAPSTAYEYDTAVSHSTTTATSHDFHTAVSSASIHESLNTIDSESSGHLGSAEVSSEMSETLVPSGAELEHDIDLNLTASGISYDESRHGIYSRLPIEPYDQDIPVDVIRAASSSSVKSLIDESHAQPVEAVIKTVADEKLLSLEQSSSSVSLTEGMNPPTVFELGGNSSDHMDTSQISEQSLTLSNISSQLSSSLTTVGFKDEKDGINEIADMSTCTSTSPYDSHPANSVTMFTSSNQSNDKLHVNTQVISSVEEQSIPSIHTSVEGSFELIEKPDVSEDFVVVHEVPKIPGKKEEKSNAQLLDNKTDSYTAEVIPPKTDSMLKEVKYYSVGGTPEDSCTFDGVTFGAQEEHILSDKSSSLLNEPELYEHDVEEGKKWIEKQFETDSDTVYEYLYDRAPLEDIKEEDTDEMHSSKVGSTGSQVSHQSMGSAGSKRQSLSSSPDSEALSVKPRSLIKHPEPDTISQCSLQEFEHLEQFVTLNSMKSKYSGSQDSLSGSLGKKHGSGDDISIASLEQFEGLEKSCIDAEKNEEQAREEERSLSQIEEGHESQASESESCETLEKSCYDDSDDDENYEKKMFEIDEIIRQAQTNVEKFADIDQLDKTESLGRGDSFEETSQIPDLELDQPLTNVHSSHSNEIYSGKKYIESVDLSHSLTDSLESKILPEPTDVDSLDSPVKRKVKQCTNLDSLSDRSSGSEKGDLLVEQDVQVHLLQNQGASVDSMDMASSGPTCATNQNEVNSTMSSSIASAGTNMVSSSENLEHIVSNYTNWLEGSRNYVSEVVQTVTEGKSTSNTFRTVTVAPGDRSALKMADEIFERTGTLLEPAEFHSETRCTDADGNIQVTTVVETRTVVSSEQVDSKHTYTLSDRRKDDLNHFSDELIGHLRFSSTTPQSSRKIFKSAEEESEVEEKKTKSEDGTKKKDAKDEKRS